jgi:uncharacterized membrane protein
MPIAVEGEPSSRGATPAQQDDSAAPGGIRGARESLGRLAGTLTSGRQNVHQIERILSALGGVALLGLALRKRNASGLVAGAIGAALVHRGATGHCPVYGALGVGTADDNLVQQHGAAAVLDAQKAVKVVHSVTIARSRAALFQFWRNFENLPRIMSHLEAVQVIDSRRSRWRAKAPGGNAVEWEAEIINEVPDGLIAWKSVNNATVPNAGSVHFTDVEAGRSTEVRVVLEYQPPAGLVGVAVAKLFGEEPDAQVREDLQRFKAVMEGGG